MKTNGEWNALDFKSFHRTVGTNSTRKICGIFREEYILYRQSYEMSALMPREKKWLKFTFGHVGRWLGAAVDCVVLKTKPDLKKMSPSVLFKRSRLIFRIKVFFCVCLCVIYDDLCVVFQLVFPFSLYIVLGFSCELTRGIQSEHLWSFILVSPISLFRLKTFTLK